MEAIDPQNVDSFDPRGLIGRIYVKGPLDITTSLKYNLWASWFLRSF